MSEKDETPPAYEDAKAAEAAKSEQVAEEAPKEPVTAPVAPAATVVAQPVITQQVNSGD